MKQKIMQVLFSADNELTTDELEWAANNIPNVTVVDELPYDHSASELFAACGISKADSKELLKEYNDIKRSLGDGRKSRVIEAVLKQGSPKLIRSFMIRGIAEYESNTDELMQSLKDFFKKL